MSTDLTDGGLAASEAAEMFGPDIDLIRLEADGTEVLPRWRDWRPALMVSFVDNEDGTTTRKSYMLSGAIYTHKPELDHICKDEEI